METSRVSVFAGEKAFTQDQPRDQQKPNTVVADLRNTPSLSRLSFQYPVEEEQGGGELIPLHVHDAADRPAAIAEFHLKFGSDEMGLKRAEFFTRDIIGVRCSVHWEDTDGTSCDFYLGLFDSSVPDVKKMPGPKSAFSNDIAAKAGTPLIETLTESDTSGPGHPQIHKNGLRPTPFVENRLPQINKEDGSVRLALVVHQAPWKPVARNSILYLEPPPVHIYSLKFELYTRGGIVYPTLSMLHCLKTLKEKRRYDQWRQTVRPRIPPVAALPQRLTPPPLVSATAHRVTMPPSTSSSSSGGSPSAADIISTLLSVLVRRQVPDDIIHYTLGFLYLPLQCMPSLFFVAKSGSGGAYKKKGGEGKEEEEFGQLIRSRFMENSLFGNSVFYAEGTPSSAVEFYDIPEPSDLQNLQS